MRARCLPSINGYIPRNRFAGDPDYRSCTRPRPARSAACSSTASATRLKIRQNLRYAHVDGIYRSVLMLNFVDPSDPNYPFLDASRRTVAPLACGASETSRTI